MRPTNTVFRFRVTGAEKVAMARGRTHSLHKLAWQSFGHPGIFDHSWDIQIPQYNCVNKISHLRHALHWYNFSDFFISLCIELPCPEFTLFELLSQSLHHIMNYFDCIRDTGEGSTVDQPYLTAFYQDSGHSSKCEHFSFIYLSRLASTEGTEALVVVQARWNPAPVICIRCGLSSLDNKKTYAPYEEARRDDYFKDRYSPGS